MAIVLMVLLIISVVGMLFSPLISGIEWSMQSMGMTFLLILSFCGIAYLFWAFRHYPLLRLTDVGLEVKGLFEHRKWEWQQTGPFTLSPPAGAAHFHSHIVAMYPANLVEFSPEDGRRSPDFEEADISISIEPYTKINDAKSAVEFLAEVNAIRADSIASRPLDFGYDGGDVVGGPWAARLRRCKPIFIIISLLPSIWLLISFVESYLN